MDDSVECAECGHPLERHGVHGCDYSVEGCTCRLRWTVAQIRRVRQANGLPAHYRRENH